LGADIENWDMGHLAERYRHPSSGGDVETVWGFKKDPSDEQRVDLLNQLRRIVVAELAQNGRNDSVGRAIPPHAGPLRRGEGERFGSRGQVDSRGRSKSGRDSAPSPGGEGRGEGERDVRTVGTLGGHTFTRLIRYGRV